MHTREAVCLWKNGAAQLQLEGTADQPCRRLDYHKHPRLKTSGVAGLHTRPGLNHYLIPFPVIFANLCHRWLASSFPVLGPERLLADCPARDPIQTSLGMRLPVAFLFRQAANEAKEAAAEKRYNPHRLRIHHDRGSVHVLDRRPRV